jgi:metallothionein
MSVNQCACPTCHCRVETGDWVRDGNAYCCQACYEGHPAGMTHCHNATCTCGEAMAHGQGDVT